VIPLTNVLKGCPCDSCTKCVLAFYVFNQFGGYRWIYHTPCPMVIILISSFLSLFDLFELEHQYLRNVTTCNWLILSTGMRPRLLFSGFTLPRSLIRFLIAYWINLSFSLWTHVALDPTKLRTNPCGIPLGGQGSGYLFQKEPSHWINLDSFEILQ